MLAGDYIVSLNGSDVRDVNQLVRDVGELRSNEIAKFTVIRNGQKVSLEIKIEDREDKTVNDSSKLWPGFFVRPISDKYREDAKLPRTVEGVQIYNVQAKSPAATLRLQNGDIITAVNGRKIRDVKDFYAQLSAETKEFWFDIYTMEGHNIETQKFKF